MELVDKAMEKTAQAEVQQSEFKVTNQEVLLKQLRVLENEAIGEDKVKITEIAQSVSDSLAKTKAHKELCQMMCDVIFKTKGG